MSRRSLSELFAYFDKKPRDFAYAQPAGYRTERWTYQKVAETAGRFARELESRSIHADDRIILLGPNSAEWAAAFWGSVLRGVVVVPMDWVAAQDFIERVAKQVDAKLIVVARERASFSTGAPLLILEDLCELVSHHPAGTPGARYASPVLDRGAIAEIVFTSGTTGDPKGVVLTDGNLLANIEPIEREILKYLKYEWIFHPVRFLNLVPLSHVFGQIMGLFLPAVMSGCVIFQNSFSPADVARTIRRERVSVLIAVPRILEALRNKVERDLAEAGRAEWLTKQRALAAKRSFHLRPWRFRRIHSQFGWKFWALISGGATLPKDTEEFWDQLGYAVVQGYGMTETAALISLNHPFHRGKGSIGKAMPGGNIKLDTNGEILVRGETVSNAYWRGTGIEPSETIGESWLRTGDIGEQDAEGHLYFKGRSKNVVVTPAGMKVFPEDLEAALRRQPEIRDCVVLPVAAAAGGNAEAFAVLLMRESSTDAAANAASAVARANQSLAEFQHIRRWMVWPNADFPRTATGKPRIGAIAERIAAPVVRAVSKNELQDLIAKFSSKSAPGTTGDLSESARLETDLGLSSLDRVELMSALEDRYQISINEAELSPETTVADLAKILQHTEPVASHDSFPIWPQRWPATWTRAALYTLIFWPLTQILARPRVRGREHLRGKRGPLFIVCNHITDEDVAFVMAALPRRYRCRLCVGMDGERLRAMRHPAETRGAWRSTLDKLNAFLLALIFNVFPLPRKSGFRESFRFAGESVDRGFSVLVFPEGQETVDGSMQEFRSGAGLLAANLSIPVLPMRIDGLFEPRQQQKIWLKAGLVRVSIGHSVQFPLAAAPDEITCQLHDLIVALEWPADSR
jgi:long-chain acyl-CoA synthetase